VNTFDKVKNEMAAGGSVTVQNPLAKPSPATVAIGLGAWVALFAALYLISPWMVVFAVGVAVTIILHEFGHYITALRSGMKVTQFFVGFGPRVWSFHRNGIEYGLRSIPLGGFVRIIGMNNLDEIPPEDEPFTYRAATFPKRLLVISAGSIMHMIIAIALIAGVYSLAGRVEETGRVVLVEAPTPGSPAAAAGLLQDDQIVALDGRAITTRAGLNESIRSFAVGTSITVTVLRDGVTVDLRATTAAHPDIADKPTSYLGVRTDSQARVDKSLLPAVGTGAHDLVVGVGQAISGIVKIVNPVNVYSHLAGTNTDLTTRPSTLVGATRMSDDIGAFDGWAGVLSLLASLNVSVGVFNMFPLLPLDGGHASIAIYERIRSRRGCRYVADVSKLMPVLAVTITLLLFMFLTGLYLDIAKPLR
jgi:membrane-associated protease RseP (regulator of RpoE activity)